MQSSPAALELRQAYRHHTLEAAIHERDIKETFGLLRANGIEPVLIKGWASARVYPEKGLRPYDDIDLVIPAARFSAAEALVREHKRTVSYVDLHRGFKKVDPRAEGDLFADSQLVGLGDVEVRVLRPEAHLRVLCIHLLRHGAFRPLWLCDVAVAVESRPPAFDWDRCLGRKKRTADWITCTIGLAHRLLGARIDDLPLNGRANRLPSWLIPSVLTQWEKPFSKDHGPAKHREPMMSYLRNPRGLLSDLRRRWPNPIEATVYVGGPFNELPRLPFQIGECIGRTAKFLARLPKALRQ